MLQTVFTTKGSEQSFTHSAAWQKVIVFIEKPSLHYVLIKCKITNPFVTLRSVKKSQEMSCILRTMWVSTSRPHTLRGYFPMLSQRKCIWCSASAKSASISSKKVRNCLCFNPLNPIKFSVFTTGSYFLKMTLQRLSSMMKLNNNTLVSGKSLILSFNNVTRFKCLPVSEGAPSIVILARLYRVKQEVIRMLMILLYKTFPVVVSLRDSMDDNSSVISKCSSIHLI